VVRGDPDLRPILGLAWDCGAVTTGPVTVLCYIYICIYVYMYVCVCVCVCVILNYALYVTTGTVTVLCFIMCVCMYLLTSQK